MATRRWWKLSIITKLGLKTTNTNLNNIISGEILLEDYMKPMGLSQNALARAIGVPPRRVNEIVHGKRAVTLDTSLRLGRYFGQSPRFWLNLQNECDLRNAGRLIKRIEREVRPLTGAA
jgi:antitoxin HigA-1